MKGYLLEKQTPSSGNCHYSFKIVDNVAKLFHAKMGNWTSMCKGKKIVEFTDDKNGNFIIKFAKGPEVTLDICQLAELVLLTKAYNKAKPNTFTKYEMVTK